MADNDEVDHVANTLRNYVARETADSTYREVVRLLQFLRADRPIDRYIAEFDLLPRKAESQMHMGAAFPDAFVSVLCVRNAVFSRQANHWRRPVRHRAWFFRLWPRPREDYLGFVAARPVRKHWWRMMGTRP